MSGPKAGPAGAEREVLSPADRPRTQDVCRLTDPLPGVVHTLRAGAALLSR